MERGAKENLDLEGKAGGRHYSSSFFLAYFFYYGAYCVFASFIVLFLTERSYSATVCGIISSLALLANLLMEAVGGYVTDTFLSVKRYLLLCIAVVSGLCVFNTWFQDIPVLMLPTMVLVAGIAYPFSQLMDAWVSVSRTQDPELVYSQIRAGGSIGYAVMSSIAGLYFKQRGWNNYFLIQMGALLLMVPFLIVLPDTSLGNRKGGGGKEGNLSLPEAFRVLVKKKNYVFCLVLCTLYWFSHRPVGSYLSLIIASRGGDAGTYGNICGVGAAVEFISLLLMAGWLRNHSLPPLTALAAALLTNLLRPVCFQFLPGIWSIYLGQILQSVSFSFFYSASVDCFTAAADKRIRSFSISFGLTASTVVGTVAANLIGGGLCDWLGTEALSVFSLVIGILDLALYGIYRRTK